MPPERIHLTAVVICYRLEHYVDRAIASIVNQTRRPDRLILLGTDCREETKVCLNAWLGHPYAQECGVEASYTSESMTCTQSKNLAGKLSGVQDNWTSSPDLREEAFFTLDADDWIQPHFIERCMGMLEASNYAGVGCDYLIYSKQGVCTPAGVNEYEIRSVRKHNVMPSASILRKSVFEKMGGYPEGFAWEDWAYWLTLYFNGYQFCRYPMPLYVHVRHETNKTNDDDRLTNLAEIDRHIEELESKHAERSHTIRGAEIRRPLDP